MRPLWNNKLSLCIISGCVRNVMFKVSNVNGIVADLKTPTKTLSLNRPGTVCTGLLLYGPFVCGVRAFGKSLTAVLGGVFFPPRHIQLLFFFTISTSRFWFFFFSVFSTVCRNNNNNTYADGTCSSIYELYPAGQASAEEPTILLRGPPRT